MARRPICAAALNKTLAPYVQVLNWGGRSGWWWWRDGLKAGVSWLVSGRENWKVREPKNI